MTMTASSGALSPASRNDNTAFGGSSAKLFSPCPHRPTNCADVRWPTIRWGRSEKKSVEGVTACRVSTPSALEAPRAVCTNIGNSCSSASSCGSIGSSYARRAADTPASDERSRRAFVMVACPDDEDITRIGWVEPDRSRPNAGTPVSTRAVGDRDIATARVCHLRDAHRRSVGHRGVNRWGVRQLWLEGVTPTGHTPVPRSRPACLWSSRPGRPMEEIPSCPRSSSPPPSMMSRSG